MKRVILFLIGSVALYTACKKPLYDTIPQPPTVEMKILKAVTLSTVMRNNGVQVSTVTCEAPDSCYTYTSWDIKPLANKTFELRALANYADPNKGPGTCTPAIHQVDIPFFIGSNEPGPLVIRFYNGTQLVEADTVIIQ